MENEDLKQLVKEFLHILDIVEESDGGRVFRPTFISSVRALDSARLDEILSKMRMIVRNK